MVKHIRYTHPAAREYISDMSYKLEDVLKHLEIEEIKIFFTPINFDWKDLEEKVVVEKKK